MHYLDLDVIPIYISDLSETKIFQRILELIKKDYKNFLLLYNKNLDEFRKENHIKNPLFPFKNLKENELPFWISDGFHKRTLIIHDNTEKEMIFPKAFSLSLCIRLFLADLMIHGIGGNIYEKVSVNVIKQFFSTEVQPHIVATATLPLSIKAGIPIEFESVQTVQSKIRRYKFNPEKFISEDCYLKNEKNYLIHLKNYYDFQKTKNNKFHFDLEFLNRLDLKTRFHHLFQNIEKNPELYGTYIHTEMKKINHKLHLYTMAKKRIFENELEKAKEVERNQEVLYERTYPVFYYDLKNFKNLALENFYQ